jgi:TP901 family phage tail tape measure protein
LASIFSLYGSIFIDNSKADKAIVGTKKKAEAFAKQMDQLGKKVTNLGKNMTTKLSLPIVAVGTLITKSAVDFETSFAQVKTLLDKGSTDYDTYKKDILKASSEMGIGVDQYSESVYQAISAGIKQGDAVDFVKNQAKLAKGGFTDLTTAVDTTTSVLNAYKLETSASTRVNDVLIATQNRGKTTVAELGASLSNVIPTASALNVNIEQVGSSLAIMTAQGIPTAQSTTSLNGILAELGKKGTSANKAMVEASKGTKMAGLSFAEMGEEGFSLGDVLNNMREYAEKNGLSLIDMFGSIEAGKGALAITSDANAFNATLTKMFEQSGATNEAFKTVSDTAENRMAVSLNKLKNAGIQLGDKLIPIVEKITNAITKLTDWFSNLDEGQQKMLLTVLGVVAALGPLLMVIGFIIGKMPIIIGAFKVFGLIMGVLFSPIGLIIAAIGGLIAAIIYAWKNFEWFRNAIKNIMNGIGWAVSSVFKGVVNSIIWAINIVTRVLNGFMAGVLAPFNAIIWGINQISGANLPYLRIAIPKIPSFRTGLDEVPHDDFVANLHKGERVLTASEAKEYKEKDKKETSSTINNIFNIDQIEIKNENDIKRIAEELFYLQKKEAFA